MESGRRQIGVWKLAGRCLIGVLKVSSLCPTQPGTNFYLELEFDSDVDPTCFTKKMGVFAKN